MEQKKCSKRLILPIIAVAVIAICAVLFFLLGSKEKNGYYKNLAWGTDKAAVRSKAEKMFDVEEMNWDEHHQEIQVKVKNYDGMKGLNAIVVFDFEEEKLEEVTIYFCIDKDGMYGEYTGGKLVDLYVTKFDKLFGEHTKGGDSLLRWSTPNGNIYMDEISMFMWYDQPQNY